MSVVTATYIYVRGKPALASSTFSSFLREKNSVCLLVSLLSIFLLHLLSLPTRISVRISFVALISRNVFCLVQRELFMKYSMDSIFEVGFGQKLGILEGSNEEAIRFPQAFDQSNALTYHRYLNLFWKVQRFLNVGTEATLRKNIAVVDEFINKIISPKQKQYSSLQSSCVKEDILSRFLLEREKNPETMNDRYLRDITLNFMIAGKDTTGVTLSWFIYMLCQHPLIQEKIAEEVKDTVGSCEKGQFTQFVERITEGALEKLHYLHAALSETLRLYPAVPIDRQSACKDDILPNGFKVKKGDGINHVTYAMGRMKYILGKDAAEFRPERWLHDRAFRPKSPFKFPAFRVKRVECSLFKHIWQWHV